MRPEFALSSSELYVERKELLSLPRARLASVQIGRLDFAVAVKQQAGTIDLQGITSYNGQRGMNDCETT
jgi:hypothetical protein